MPRRTISDAIIEYEERQQGERDLVQGLALLCLDITLAWLEEGLAATHERLWP